MTTPPPGDGEVCTDCRRINGGVCAVPENCPTAPSEPPAEAQQDDERFDTPRADAVTAVHLMLMTLTRGSAADHYRNAVAIVDAVAEALAARPSADTETLRRVRALVARHAEATRYGDDRVPLADLRAALDGDRR